MIFWGGEDAELPIASPEQPNEGLGVPSFVDAPTKDHDGNDNQQNLNFQTIEQIIEALIDVKTEEDVEEIIVEEIIEKTMIERQSRKQLRNLVLKFQLKQTLGFLCNPITIGQRNKHKTHRKKQPQGQVCKLIN